MINYKVVQRGGSWWNTSSGGQVFFRNGHFSDSRVSLWGFRLTCIKKN
jgi:formylglycine-generating enzyme required for sulfatase activity